MKKKYSDIKDKLAELYFVTGIPVALITSTNEFNHMYPETTSHPNIDYIAQDFRDMMDSVDLPIQTPFVNHIFLQCFYCLIPIDHTAFVHIGPVSSHDINMKRYLSGLSLFYSSDIVAHHMKMIQGSPKVDLNYFVNIIIMATHFLFNKKIDRDDIVYDDAFSTAFDAATSMFTDRTTTSIDQLSFEDEIYSVIKAGNIDRLKELQEKNTLSSFFFFQENDIHFLRIAFIFYGAIACHYATLGGLHGKTVKKLFSEYLETMNSLTEPKEYWIMLPKLSSTLCYKVHELNETKYDSDVLNTCISYIRDNLYSKITVADLESYTNVSGKTILRHFKQYLQTTPSEYIADEKLREIAHILETSSMDILDISTMFGYSSQSHLNRCFSKKYGCTPLQYRKNSL